MDNQSDDFFVAPIARLTKDLANASKTLSHDEARFLVDSYYQMQKDRIRSSHQMRALSESGEPHSVLAWLGEQSGDLEKQLQRALGKYAEGHVAGAWSLSVCGIGPVIAAGLLAHIDITKADTVGSIWRFAGLDPTVSWGKGQKRPWNTPLKRLCFIIGESFVKVSGLEQDVYGKVYKERKNLEIMRNDQGLFADQAAKSLAEKNFGEDTDARAWYEGCFPAGAQAAIAAVQAAHRITLTKQLKGKPGSGVIMLPPARIHMRAKRYAVKLFLSHYHHVLHESVLGRPPEFPYILNENVHTAHPEFAAHTHFIAPPNWPMLTK